MERTETAMSMVEPILSYVRTLNFTGPDLTKRYYRLFGDLEYDLAALRAEITVMELRIREVRRRLERAVHIGTEEERDISVAAHELAEPWYDRLEALHARITASRGFQFNSTRERQSYFLFSDIALAIMGIEDETVRRRELLTFARACEAYSQLDINALTDLHDTVQDLLALERRDSLDSAETESWQRKLQTLLDSHPLRSAHWLDDPEKIEQRLHRLRRRIGAEQQRLEHLGMLYTAAIKCLRYCN
jgi:hypothetical protein